MVGDSCKAPTNNGLSGDYFHGDAQNGEAEEEEDDTEDEAGQTCDYEPGLEFDDTELERDKPSDGERFLSLSIVHQFVCLVLLPFQDLLPVASPFFSAYASITVRLFTQIVLMDMVAATLS